ncbi:MAG TPA: gluconate 2-dehydrogenase subunit 3 family protein [Bryobacteraceae bacterium]
MKKSPILNEIPLTRRTVMAGATLVPLAALIAPAPAGAQSPGAAASTKALSADQRQILDAFIDRLVPKDELGPGAVECGVGDYIDRCLAGFNAAEKPQFLEGLSNLDVFSLRTQGIAFAGLSADKRDAVLTAIDNNQAPELRGFFNRVRRLTLEGMFSDPVYGGNKNFAGWDLIGYPGAKMAVAAEDQRMKTLPKPYRKELYSDTGFRPRTTGENHGH